MNCPKCGAEIAKESLYCENCGEDIHIVPDYDPELEYNLDAFVEEKLQEETIDSTNSQAIVKSTKHKRETPENKTIKSRLFHMYTIIICIISIILTIVCIFIYQNNSYQYLMKHAIKYMNAKNYEKAIVSYERAIAIDVDNIDIRLQLAEAYRLNEDMAEYEYILWDIINMNSATYEQLETVYGRLISIYKNYNNYAGINAFLQECNNSDIKIKFQNYIVKEPEFNYEEGYYQEILPLKLSSSTSGTIYYTIDGSTPTKESEQYTAPIFLENGTYVINAFYENDNGVNSQIVTRTYTIDVKLPNAPQINLESGQYHIPELIEVFEENDGNIYYTTDGTMPTLQSNLYTGPIPMPVGESHFKFAQIEQVGFVGDVAERKYELILDTDITIEHAKEILVTLLTDVNLADITTKDYTYLYATNIENIDDFYVFAEKNVDANGNSTRTGSYFAVNIYTGNCFKLQISEVGKYSLIEII